MIPADVEPSLCTAEPRLDSLEDGFSPPPTRMNAHSHTHHPVEPEPMTPGDDDSPAPNPTQLPIEPEFGQALPQAEPEDPGVPRPAI